jgi:general secretion pathway protein K
MRRARGVALIVALVVVALATILATRIGAQGALDQRRGATLLAQDQAFQVALAAETWAIEVLRDHTDRQVPRDTLDEAWATPLPPIPIDGGSVQGQLEDMQGRFNLNNLVKPDGTKNDLAFAQFQRLLARLELEPKWASLMLDWIDTDSVADGIDGAEDGVYTAFNPPYRTANRPITSISELLALPGFGTARYQRLAPFVAALPVGSRINVCTASGIVLDSIAPGLDRFGQDPKALAANREKGCFPAKNDVDSAVSTVVRTPADLEKIKLTYGESSKWFRGTTTVSIGTTELTLYSLFERNPGAYARVVLRTLGTE